MCLEVIYSGSEENEFYACICRWDPIQDDGGADVKHYIVEYFRDVWDVWLKARTTKDCEVGIEDLIPGSR